MTTKKRWAVVAAALVALAVAGTATEASGAVPSPGPTKAAAAGKQATPDPDKAAAAGNQATPDADLVAAAAALGVTPDALTAAISAAKQSFATASGTVTDEAFIGAVADRLGLPVARVGDALRTMISRPGRTGDKPDGKGKDGNAAEDSPLRTEAAAQAFAASTGVTVEQARAALATLAQLSAADGGLEPTSPAFGAVAAGLGISVDQLVSALDRLKSSLNGG